MKPNDIECWHYGIYGVIQDLSLLAVILNYCASGCIPRGAFFVRILLLMGARRMKGGFILFNFGGVVVVIKMCLNFLFMNHQVVNKKRRVVVVGAGFAGLNFVKHIDKRYFEVIVIDRHNYHSFPPLFYQVASAGLDPASICFPLRRELRKLKSKDVRYHMGEVKRIDVACKKVYTKEEAVEYDILVVAAGTTNNFFNMPELEKTVHTLKSTPEALRCRNDILDLLERAALEKKPDVQRRMLSFVVVGGGPTGVEIAGAIGEMKRYVLPREYPSIPQDNMTITLVEGSGRLLGVMSDKASEKAIEGLKSLMVNVSLGVSMSSYNDKTVVLSDGSRIPASLVIWTAGVTGRHFEIDGAATDPIGRGNRFKTDGFCRVEGMDDVYALGDIAIMQNVDDAFPDGHPQLAQVAIQQGRLVAKNLNSEVVAMERGGKTVVPDVFIYRDKGAMATIGRNRAVVDMKHARLSGFSAWLAWMFVHLISLLGMRNKITVMVNWIWAYFNYSTSLRLLIHPCRYPLRTRWFDD